MGKGHWESAQRLRAEGRGESAIAEMERALGYTERIPEIYVALAEQYLVLGKPKIAREKLEKTSERLPKSAGAFLLRARIHIALEDWDPAKRSKCSSVSMAS